MAYALFNGRATWDRSGKTSTPTPLALSTTTLPAGTVGSNYNQALAATGGTPPYTWSIISGSLPAGLSLNAATGVISGTPTTVGTSNFSVQVRDNVGTTTSKALTLTITAANIAPTIAALTATPQTLLDNATSQLQVVASDADGPSALSYTWTILSGGGSLNNSAIANPIYTPANVSASTTVTINVAVSDGAAIVNQSITLTVNDAGLPLSISTASLANGTVGSAYSQTLVATGGITPYTWSLVAGSLPVGLSLNVATGVISGTPTTPGISNFTVQVSDAIGANDTQTLTLTISAAGADFVWVEDAVPSGAILVGANDGWNFISTNPAPFSGNLAHQSGLVTGTHQHYFYNATVKLSVSAGDTLFTYVYLDPSNPPTEVMLAWYGSKGGWEHRAYWGANSLNFGVNGTASRRYMGPLPAAGGWVRLEVPASAVGLEGVTVDGMAYALFNGRATWDRSGKTSP